MNGLLALANGNIVVVTQACWLIEQRPRSFSNGFNSLGEESQRKKERARKALNLPLSSTTADTKGIVHTSFARCMVFA